MRRVAAALTALLLLAACSDDGGGDDASGSSAEETTTTAAAEDADDAEPEVELPAGAPVVEVLDHGEEPRQELRFDPREGDEHRVTVRQEQTQEISAGGQQQTAAVVMELDLTYRIEEVTDGVIETVVVYDDVRLVEADDAVRGAIEGVLSGLAGAEGRTEFDRRGYVLANELPDIDVGSVPGGEQLLGSLESQIGALAVPFPDEAVGEGARWTVDTTAEFAGILQALTTYTFHLTGLDDDEYTADVEAELTFESVGGPFEVESGSLTGTGTVTWPADSILGLFDQTLEGTVVLSAQGQRITQRQEQRVVMTPR